MMDLQPLLDRINRRWGGVGSVISTAFWLALLYYAIFVILWDVLR